MLVVKFKQLKTCLPLFVLFYVYFIVGNKLDRCLKANIRGCDQLIGSIIYSTLSTLIK